jgi:hypothetical protein
MAPEPPAPAAKPGPGPGAKGKGKPLSLKSPWTWVIIGGIALVGGAYLLWRRSQSAAASTSATGTAPAASPDYSGALGTLQDEIGNLQSSGGYGGGTSVVPVTSDSGGAGTTSTVTGPSTGDTTSSGSGTTTSTSSGSGSGGGGTSTATAAAPTVSAGHVVSVKNNTAVVAWTGTGASQWKVQIVGPGAINGRTNTVGIPQASYSGLEAGHNYTVTVQPLVGGKPAGTPGQITFKTTTG